MYDKGLLARVRKKCLHVSFLFWHEDSGCLINLVLMFLTHQHSPLSIHFHICMWESLRQIVKNYLKSWTLNLLVRLWSLLPWASGYSVQTDFRKWGCCADKVLLCSQVWKLVLENLSLLPVKTSFGTQHQRGPHGNHHGLCCCSLPYRLLGTGSSHL